ncbi:MAG TPA: MerR family transcriptional regulator [Actinomycetota bacterium]|nr:MerR family transcriptional regulator [Actinomycetota bacterium]
MQRPMSEGGVRIATVSATLDIPVPTIRSWERRYGFPAPSRTGGRHRRYTRAEIEQLRDLRDLIIRGYPAREAVAHLMSASVWGGDEGLLDEVVDSAMRLDPDGIRLALDRSAERVGVELTIRDVLFRAMREIGARWKAGTCDVEQEHLATASARAWLARQLTMAPRPFRPDPVVLACGPKDLHAIGIEAFAVVLARHGWPCRVLGALTPAAALTGAVQAVGAVGALVTVQRSVTRRAALESLAAVEALPGVRAFYAGDAFLASSSRRDVPGVYLGDDVLRAVDVLEEALGAAYPGRRASTSRPPRRT